MHEKTQRAVHISRAGELIASIKSLLKVHPKLLLPDAIKCVDAMEKFHDEKGFLLENQFSSLKDLYEMMLEEACHKKKNTT